MPTPRFIRVLVYALFLPWIVVCLWKTYYGFWIWLAHIPLVLAAAYALRRFAERRWFQALEITLWNVVLILVLFEIGLRMFIAFGDAPIWMTPEPNHVVYRLNPNAEWMGDTPNSKGFFEEEFVPKEAGRTRVAVLGDSFVVGMVPFAQNYITLADRALGDNVEVINLGVVHTAPPEYLQILRTEALPLEPDLIVLSIFLGNDIQPAESSGLFSRAGSVAFQTLRMLNVVLKEGAPFKEQSSLEGFLPLQADGTRREIAGMSVDRHLKRGWKHLQRIHQPPQDVRMRRAWEDTIENIQKIVAETQDAGIPVIATIAPEELQISNAYLRDTLKAKQANAEDFELQYSAKRISEIFRELGVPTLYFDEAIRDAEASAPTYHLRALHWNQHGNAAAAKALVTFIQQHLP